MDPLSITVSVSSLIVFCAKVIKASHDLCSQFKSAAFTLSAITSECSVINASLSNLQSLILEDPERLQDASSTFEIALLGCALTMSVLDEEIGGVLKETNGGTLTPKRFKYVLEQDHLKELLQQIRGQQIAISLLLQTYQR